MPTASTYRRLAHALPGANGRAAQPQARRARVQRVQQMLSANDTGITILSLDELETMWTKYVAAIGEMSYEEARRRWNGMRPYFQFTADKWSAGQDLHLLVKLLADLGFATNKRTALTQVYFKSYGGKPRIILKGYPGQRAILNATSYGVTNLKIMKMGVGRVAAGQVLRSGGVLTVVLLSGYRVLDFVLRDGATLTRMIGSLATDIVKVAISVGVGIAAAAFPGLAVFAIGPLFVAIVVSVPTSAALTRLDNHYQVTEHLIDALGRLSDAAAAVAGQISDTATSALTPGREEDRNGFRVLDLAEEAIAESLRDAARSAKRAMLREVSELIWTTPRVGV